LPLREEQKQNPSTSVKGIKTLSQDTKMNSNQGSGRMSKLFPWVRDKKLSWDTSYGCHSVVYAAEKKAETTTKYQPHLCQQGLAAIMSRKKKYWRCLASDTDGYSVNLILRLSKNIGCLHEFTIQPQERGKKAERYTLSCVSVQS
jgi:hypothetical protein